MAISLVTVTTPAASATNGGNVTINLGTLQQNDLVIAFGGHPFRSGAVAAGPSTAGYTQIFAADVTPSCSFWVGRKFMGATPDTQFVGLGSGNASDAASYGVFVLRGVDQTTPLDVAATNAAAIDPPSITTVTDNAWVLALTISAVNDTSPGTITNFTNTITSAGNDTVDSVIAGATRVKTPAGAENPAAWSTLTSTNPRSVTLAIRPSSGTTHQPSLATEDTGVTDTRLITQSKGLADSAGVTDTRSITQKKEFVDETGIVDAFEIIKARMQAEQDAVNLTDQSAITQRKGLADSENVTDSLALNRQKELSDNTGLTDTFQTIKSKFLSFENLVETTSNIFFTVRKGIASSLGISDSVFINLIEGGSGGAPMSLVDEKRLVIGALLGITEPALSALSINDLLHRYWSSTFPVAHAYEGSSSGLTTGSIMDHHSRVEDNEDTDLNWIRGVV
jgi:hypothetical protein